MSEVKEIEQELLTPTHDISSAIPVYGRPTKYKPEYCQRLIAFYEIEPYTDKEITHFFNNGQVSRTDSKRIANKLPTLRAFAKSINVGISTVYDWLNPNHESYQPAFSDAFLKAKDLLKWFLIENGLNGCYNPMYSIFVATNLTDMRKQTENTENRNINVNINASEKTLTALRELARQLQLTESEAIRRLKEERLLPADFTVPDNSTDSL